MAKKKGMSNEDKKALAYELYLETDKTGKEISGIVRVTEKTYSGWKAAGDWELHKQAQTITAKNIVANIYEKAYALSLEEKIDADKLVKLANTIEKLSNRKITLAQIMAVLKDFTLWAMRENAEQAKQLNVLHRKYVDYKINGE